MKQVLSCRMLVRHRQTPDICTKTCRSGVFSGLVASRSADEADVPNRISFEPRVLCLNAPSVFASDMLGFRCPANNHMRRRLLVSRRSILSVCPAVPRPDMAAGDRRLFALLEILARSNRVDLYAEKTCNDVAYARYLRALRAAGVNVLPTDGLGWFAGVLRSRQYDIGLFEFWHTAARFGNVFRELQPWAKLVVDSVDVHFRREEGEASLGFLNQIEVVTNRREELDTYRAADAVVAISDDDRRSLEQVGGMPTMYIVPIIVPIHARPELARQHELLFVGSFKHRPNPDGLLWFVKDVWPSIRNRIPNASLTIVGSEPTSEILDLNRKDGINVAGYVPDTAPYLDRAAVSIAPLRFGAGMKGKVTEALARGIPVVTTSIGAQGFGIVSGEHAMIADDAASFAEAVSELLSDPSYAKKMGETGQALVAGICSPEAAGGKLLKMIDEISATIALRRQPFSWRLRSTCYRVAELMYPTLKRFRRVYAGGAERASV